LLLNLCQSLANAMTTTQNTAFSLLPLLACLPACPQSWPSCEDELADQLYGELLYADGGASCQLGTRMSQELKEQAEVSQQAGRQAGCRRRQGPDWLTTSVLAALQPPAPLPQWLPQQTPAPNPAASATH